MSDTAPIEHRIGLTDGDFTAADEPFRLFARWLDDELEQLEERQRAFWTPQSVLGVLLAICQSR